MASLATIGVGIVAVFLLPTTTNIAVQQAFGTHYWTGWWWSNISHPQEFKQISGKYYVPYRTLNTQLATLPFVAGKDPQSTSITAIKAAGAKWNGHSSAWGLTNDQTATSYWDHTVGASDLAAGKLGFTDKIVHPDFHLVKAWSILNNDPADVKWNYLADTASTNPDTVDILKVMIHEFGHWVMYCETYPGGDTQSGNCNGHTTQNSVMWSYVYDPAGATWRNLFTHDKSSVTTIYGG